MNTNVKIEFESFALSLPNANNNVIDKNSKIMLKIYILNKIKIMDVDLKKIDMKKDKIDEQIDKLKNKFLKDGEIINLKFVKNLKELNIGLENVDFKISLGVEDAALTGILVGTIASIIGILLNGQKYKDVKYLINPVYENRNILNIDFQGIIVLNFRNIISIF